MELKTFANIDLSTPDARKEVMNYLDELHRNFNICENTPDEIVNCAVGMLKALDSLNKKLLILHDGYYFYADRTARMKNVENIYKSYNKFHDKEREYLSRVRQFGGGADEIIPEIRKIARELRDCISWYHFFSVKVVDYTVLLVI